MLHNPAFHHIELPCPDLEIVERFYGVVLGARVYMRRDATRRADVPAGGTITDAEALGFDIDATFLRIGENFRIGFLRRDSEHAQREIDHLAFTIEDNDLAGLGRRFIEYNIEVVDQSAQRLQIKDPFGLMIELWPRSVLAGMGLV
jgi:catechol 2,3-dioxygenase-like lactoylglutathione lyase family enzyme